MSNAKDMGIQLHGLVRDGKTGKPKIDNPRIYIKELSAMMTRAERAELGWPLYDFALTPDGLVPIDRVGDTDKFKVLAPMKNAVAAMIDGKRLAFDHEVTLQPSEHLTIRQEI